MIKRIANDCAVVAITILMAGWMIQLFSALNSI
jgi:hypothetical protein